MEAQDFDLKQIVTKNKFVGLWRMMTGFRWAYLGATIAIGVATLAQTGSYYLLQYFIDDVLSGDNMAQVVPWIAIAFVILALIQGAFTYLSGRWAAHTAEGATRRLRNYFYDHIQRLTFTYHDKQQTGELLQRATSDVDALRRLFSEQAIGAGRIVLLFVINFVALLSLNVELAIYSIVIIPVVLAISLVFFVRIERAYEKFQEQDAVVSNRLQENLSGVRVVKAFARQEYERDKFEVENTKKLSEGIRLLMVHAFFWPTTDIMCAVQMLAGFFLAARMAINGDISVGTYLAYHGFVIQIIWPIRNLGRLITQMSTGFVSLQRLIDIIQEDREPLDVGSYVPNGNLRGDIRFHNVNFAYEAKDAKQVLHDITFTAESGQVIALLGSTGSGKTSLVNLLPRFYGYNEGSITVDGVELREYPRSYLRRQIGIVQQEPFLFSRSIRDNITYGVGRDVSDEEVIAAAKAADVHDVVLSFPEGYKTMVGERGVTLSGGQKQRVTIARTLLKNPRILILDDATSSVDTETEASIRESLNGLMGKCTTFIIAHRIQSVMHADLILVLDNGRIVQRGTHHELIHHPGIYQQIYQLQARIEEELEKEIEVASVAVNGRSNGHLNGQANGQQPSVNGHAKVEMSH